MATRRKKRRRARTGRVLLILVFTVAALVAVYNAVVRPPDVDTPNPEPSAEQLPSAEEVHATADPSAIRKNNFFTILVSGVDDGNGGSDTNILVAFDAKNGVCNCVSIPRDTLVNVNRKVKKFNAAYNAGGVEQLRKELSDLLGIPVDFYIQVDLEGFIELVDAIGGVDFDIPINMNYDDPLQGLSIHFRKGMQHLNGQQAMEVVRFRHNNDGTGYGTEDVGRIGTQQAFLKAVAQQTLQPSNLNKASAFAKLFQKYVKTDLALNNLAWFGQEAIQMGTGNINFYTLPGDGAGYYKGISYYVLDPEATLEMVNGCLNPYEQPRTMSDLNLLIP